MQFPGASLQKVAIEHCMIQELESTITIGARRPQKLDEGKKKKKR
jgi:hypothetical protein